jgi:hypothetical protein
MLFGSLVDIHNQNLLLILAENVRLNRHTLSKNTFKIRAVFFQLSKFKRRAWFCWEMSCHFYFYFENYSLHFFWISFEEVPLLQFIFFNFFLFLVLIASNFSRILVLVYFLPWLVIIILIFI